jgi:Ca2+-binding EF-hand superfamily protein
MRVLFLIVGVLGVCWAAGSAAAAESDASRLFKQLDGNRDGHVAPDEAGADHGRLFARLVRTSDDDGDGVLSADEFVAGLTPVRGEKPLIDKQGSRLPGSDALVVLLAKMDVNGDRRLVADEIPERFQDAFDRMLERADEDKDGLLSTRELAQGGPRLGIIATAAARRLGIDVAAELAKLSPKERQAMERMDAYARPGELMADPEQAAELFARLDANGDGRVAADEAPEGLVQLVRRGDRDGDGQLSKGEFQQMSRRLARLQQRSGRGRPEPAMDDERMAP